MDDRSIEQLVRDTLAQGFSPYFCNQHVDANKTGPIIDFEYSTRTNSFDLTEHTRLSVQVDLGTSVAELANITIAGLPHRQGYGGALLSCTEHIAQALGARKMIALPSGTYDNKQGVVSPNAEFYMKRGYVSTNMRHLEKVLLAPISL